MVAALLLQARFGLVAATVNGMWLWRVVERRVLRRWVRYRRVVISSAAVT